MCVSLHLDSNYHRYNSQQTNSVDLKYDSAGNSTSNSVTPPSNSNSTNTTASPSNLASPSSLNLNNVSPSTVSGGTNVATQSPSNQNDNDTTNSNNNSKVPVQPPVQQQPQTANDDDRANDKWPNDEQANDEWRNDEQANDDQVKVVEQQQPTQSLVESTTKNLVRDLSNLQISTSTTTNHNAAKQQPHSILNEKTTQQSNPVLANHHHHSTASFKPNGGSHQTYSHSNVNNSTSRSPHSPFVGGGMMSSNNGGFIPTSKSMPLNHYNGKYTQSNKIHYGNYPMSPMTNLNGGNNYQFPNNKLSNNYPNHPRGKKSQHPNVHLLSSNNKTNLQTVNQSNLPNGNNYVKMNANNPHLQPNKMIQNPNANLSGGGGIPTAHPQMIPPNASTTALFYHPNLINQQQQHLNHHSSQNHQPLPNLHHQNVHHLPHNCIQCQSAYFNGQYLPPNAAYHPAQFVAFQSPYQYNPAQTVPPISLSQQTQQPRGLTYAAEDLQPSMSRANQSNAHQQPPPPQTGPNNTASHHSTPNKYQQPDHFVAPTHLPPTQFTYNPYMHFIPPNYYYPAANTYMQSNNESQLSHMISNSSAALLAQQQQQQQISAMNNLQQQQQAQSLNANHQQMVMNQPNEQFAVGSTSSVETISNNISADNSRSNSANYESTALGNNSLLPNANQANPPNAISPFDAQQMNNNGKYYTNYATNSNALTDYNQMIWTQQQQNPNLLISNTASNTTSNDFLSSHNLTNQVPNKTAQLANTYNTETSASSNLVNSENTVLDKK